MYKKQSISVNGLKCLLVGLIFFTANNLTAAERLFFENFEDTSFSTWFAERSMGTSSYWSELTSEITRSSESPHSGRYSMTYDPWVTGNPHGNIGVPTTNGNTSGFDISQVNTNSYYFRWNQRWQTGISYAGSAMNKVLYLGYHEWGGDFVVALEKSSSSGFHLLIMSNPGYVIRVNTYPSVGNLDDMAWHKMEVYVELGTTGATGTFTLTIDDNVYYHNTSVHYRDAVNINGGSSLNIVQWPSNASGTPSGNSRVWLDDLEIWDGLPSETNDSLPVVAITDPVNSLYSTSSNSIDISGTSSDDIGVSSVSWSSDRGGAGTVSGDLASWSVSGVTLLEGDNVITITATDSADQTSSDTVRITTATSAIVEVPVPRSFSLDQAQQPTSGSNIAGLATASSSSQANSDSSAASVIDGCIDGYPGDESCEWVARYQETKIGQWLELSWGASHTIDRIILYDRPNGADQITSGTLTFSDGTSLSVGPLNDDGSATEYQFSAKKITTLRLTVNSLTGNVGLSEIEVFEQ